MLAVRASTDGIMQALWQLWVLHGMRDFLLTKDNVTLPLEHSMGLSTKGVCFKGFMGESRVLGF